MAFFDRYKACCDEMGVSTHSESLANLWGVSRGSISGWKKNGIAPKQAELVKIADYFHVSTDYLLERTDDKTDYSKGVPDQAKTDSNDGQTGIKIVDMYLSLDDEDRKKAESFMDYLLSNEKYRVVQHTQAGA